MTGLLKESVSLTQWRNGLFCSDRKNISRDKGVLNKHFVSGIQPWSTDIPSEGEKPYRRGRVSQTNFQPK